MNETTGLGAIDFRRRCGIGEIQSHEWFKTRVRGQRSLNALPISSRLDRGGDGRFQIRHDDGAAETLGGELRHRLQ
jgi:hypothetical protein